MKTQKSCLFLFIFFIVNQLINYLKESFHETFKRETLLCNFRVVCFRLNGDLVQFSSVQVLQNLQLNTEMIKFPPYFLLF